VRSLMIATVLSAFCVGGVLAQGGKVYKLEPGNGVTSPVLVKEVKPNYTRSAMDRKVEGIVELSAVVQSDGTVGDAHVTRSLDDDLDEQAIIAVKQWQFRPGTKDGKAVDVEVSVQLTFTLKK
jgi:periplasmic protein TonB